MCDGIAGAGSGFQITEVGGDVGQALNAGLLVQDVQHLVDAVAVLVHQILQDAGVHVAGAGAHGETCQRSEAHGGVHGLAAVHSADGGTVAQVAGDDLQLFDGLAQHSGGALGDILVRGAVEAIAADLVLRVVLIGQSVHIGLGRHGLMESGIEHAHHGNAGHAGLAGLDAGDVGGVMQRCQGDAVLQSLHDLVGDQDRAGKGLAAVDHAVADSVDLRHGGDNAVLGVHQSVQNGLDGLGMSGHCHVDGLQGLLALHLGLIGELAVDTDALAEALGQQIAGLGVQELILQGRTACVNDKNIHDDRLLFVGALQALSK